MGWASLTPTELDVVRLACEGLGNKQIATRLFIWPRTEQAHVSHVYSKLGVGSRVSSRRRQVDTRPKLRRHSGVI